jgi:diguanylate cyclase
MIFFVVSAILIVVMISLRMMFFERAKLRKLAYLDNVTGLINRNGMDRFWDQYAGKGNLAVLFLDLDYFKNINDKYGHQAGDQLLKEVGLRLLKVTDQSEQVFRLGGDEFVIIMENANLKKAELLATRILEKFKRLVVIQGHHLVISGSIGITICEDRKAERFKLLEEADIAMYFAKKLGKSCYSVFNEDKYKFYKVLELVRKRKVSS